MQIHGHVIQFFVSYIEGFSNTARIPLPPSPFSHTLMYALVKVCVSLFQRAKKVMSDSPGLVDFAVGLVIFVLNLPEGQLLLWGEIQITEGL